MTTAAPVSGRGRVLQFSSMVPPQRFGGAERVVGWLTGELERAGCSVHNSGLTARGGAGQKGSHAIRNIYWPFDGGHRGLVRRSAWHGVDTFVLAQRRTVKALIEQVRPSVIVTHNLRGWGYAPWVEAAEAGVPLIHVVHDYGLICNASTLWRDRACADLCRACTARCTVTRRRWPGGQVVGVSRAVLGEHARLGPDFAAAALVSHPTGAAAAVGSAAPVRSAAPVARAGTTPVTLGYLGRINEAKGLALLIEAMRSSTQRLLVAGTGDLDYLDSLKSTSPGNVQWLGWTEPAAFLDLVDVLVVPSRWKEPFGLVVVEAARAGVPVLLAEQPGLVEAARSCGARYTTFAPDDEAALSGALSRPISEYRSQAPVDTVDLVTLIVQAAGLGGLVSGPPARSEEATNGG